jgi:hypothetical protein
METDGADIMAAAITAAGIIKAIICQTARS